MREGGRKESQGETDGSGGIMGTDTHTNILLSSKKINKLERMGRTKSERK